MDVRVYSRSQYLRYSIDGLVSELETDVAGRIANLFIIDFSEEKNILAMVNLINKKISWFAKPDSRVLIIGNGDVYGKLKRKGIDFIKPSSTLEEWRHVFKSMTNASAIDLDELGSINSDFDYASLTASEKEVIRGLRMNMTAQAIAAKQGIAVKTYYARIYSIKRKLALRTAREVYLNVEEIYARLVEDSDAVSQEAG